MKRLLAGLLCSVFAWTNASADGLTISELMARDADVLKVHLNANYPEIYIGVSEPEPAMFVCRVAGDASGFQRFFDYREAVPPSEIATVCAELK